MSWKANSRYHVPGTLITGQNVKHGEKIINIDDLLISDAMIANIDEAKNHYDVRSIYTTEIGESLSRTNDKNLLQLAVLAARSGSNFNGGDGFGGTELMNPDYDTDADVLAQGIFDASQAMDEKDVPESNRYVVFRPKHYNLLVQSAKAINRDWNADSSNGTYASGKVMNVAGIKIVKSNHVPNSVVAATGGENNTYDGTFTDTIGVAFHRDCVGTVKLMDLALESQYMIQYQGTLFVAKYAMGHGILRPECAVELSKET